MGSIGHCGHTGQSVFVEYEMNGENFVIEDTVVCEFNRYELSVLAFNNPMSWRRKDEKKLHI